MILKKEDSVITIFTKVHQYHSGPVGSQLLEPEVQLRHARDGIKMVCAPLLGAQHYKRAEVASSEQIKKIHSG